MADSITIAGINLKLVRFDEKIIYRGELADAFDNTPMDGRDRPRRVWTGETYAILPATYSSFRTAVAAGIVTCSGLAVLGETVSAVVTIENAARGPDVLTSGRPNYGAVNLTLTLTLREA